MDDKIEIIDTRITDTWGVEWNPMEIVRDFLQNFYDANPIEDIKIIIKDRRVIISAPAEFDYKSLIYLGSDKSTSDIGQYGEGFKAATLNAMRNYGCEVQVKIKDMSLEFFFEKEKIGETEKKIIKCKKSNTSKIIGSKLILKNCSKEIIDEFKFGLNYFYYDENPLFGKFLTQHYNSDIIIYESNLKNVGYVFYKKLLRAKLDVPFVIVCNRAYKSIDDKIRHDRDRKAFDDKVLDSLLKYVFKQVSIDTLVEFLKPWWQKGHKMLRIIASGHKWRRLSIKFPDNYYARQSKAHHMNFSALKEIENLEREFNEKKYFQCPGYMHNLGMKNALSVIQERNEKIKKKHEIMYTRTPTELEHQALNFLGEFVYNIDPLLSNKFKFANYTIGDSEEIIGELRIGRKYDSADFYLSQNFFLLPFSSALSILLHEWGHIYGYDGSRQFSDALTCIIAEIIKQRNKVDYIEKMWGMISQKISVKQFNQSSSKILLVVDKLTNKQKIQLLKSIPEGELLKLIEKEKIDIPS